MGNPVTGPHGTRLVSSDQAQSRLEEYPDPLTQPAAYDLLYTVAGEDARVRQAVLDAFLEYAAAAESNPTQAAIFSWSDLAADVREWAEHHK